MTSKIPRITGRVFGAIVDLTTNNEIDFDGDLIDTAVIKLNYLEGTEYGVHWKYAGDLTEKDWDASIYLSEFNFAYRGPNAVRDFMNDFSDHTKPNVPTGVELKQDDPIFNED